MVAMDILGWRILIMILWSISVEGTYHLKSKQVFPRPKSASIDSQFGYSIAYQPANKRLIISAPNDDIGKMYECEIQTKSCREFTNDVSIDYGKVYKHYDPKMWLGATVATGPNFTMACAPRQMNNLGLKIGTFGKCYVTSPDSYRMTNMPSVSDSTKRSLEMTWSGLKPYELYMDSLGWSVDVTNNGSIIVGGPAMFRGRAIEYSSVDADPKLLNYETMNETKFNLGYSVTSGNFYSTDNEKIIYAISTPYGSLGLGEILMIEGNESWLLQSPTSNTPHEGSIYGAAMAPANLVPEEPQALLVGAPAYADLKEGQIDVGAVYIYQFYTEKVDVSQAFSRWYTILGKVDGGRFGSAIVSCGDLDGDKRDDIAIAAPYEGSGVVYIYSGAQLTSDDSNPPYMQRVTFDSLGYNAFGLSLAPLRDHYENGCNELAIGVPENNAVVLLSCMPTITVNVADLQEKPEGNYTRARRNDTDFVFQSCVNIEYPEKPKTLLAEIQVKVTLVSSYPGLKLAKSKDGGSITYIKNIRSRTQTRLCEDVGIVIPLEHQDHPIHYEIRAFQLNSPSDQTTFNSSRALVSHRGRLVARSSVWVADCDGDICKPFFVKISIVHDIPIHNNSYTIGSTSSASVHVRARNDGDMAYGACLRLHVYGAPALRFPSSCSYREELRVHECQPKTPVKKDSFWESEKIELDLQNLKSDANMLRFVVDMLPVCSNDSFQQTNQHLLVPLKPDPQKFMIRGITNIGDIVDLSTEELKQSGKRLSHEYSVSNYGLTDWVNIKCEITMEEEDFLADSDLTIDPVRYKCEAPVKRNKKYISVCTIDELKKNQKLVIALHLFVQPKTIDPKVLKKSNRTITSLLKLTYGENEQKISVKSTLRLADSSVPIWIILVAAVVGLLIIFIIIFALYECGCLRRKNKDKLKRLKRDVHRQSIRRSQIRNSMRSVQRQSRDKQQLLKDDHSNGDEANGDAKAASEVAPMDLILDYKEPAKKETVDKGEKVKEQEKEIMVAKRSSAVPNFDKTSLDPLKSLPEEDDECKIKKKQQIIQGLQKNLKLHRSNQFLAVPTKEKDITPVSDL